jgi:hypothetical protein
MRIERLQCDGESRNAVCLNFGLRDHRGATRLPSMNVSACKITLK